MRRTSRLLVSVTAVALVASVAAAARCEAQGGFGTRPTAGIFGGVTFPRGDFSDEVGTGWHAGALAKIRLYGPLDLRLDGTYSRFGEKKFDVVDISIETYGTIAFGTLNALLNLGPDSAAYPGDNSLSPYLLGGAGRYRLDFDAECTGACETFVDPGIKTYWGWNVGAGATVPLMRIRTFVEARYHRISRSDEEGGARSMFLVSAGVKLR
jgi:hypothetical protein